MAYRAAAKRSHPDAGGDAREFAGVVKAYALLTDARRRTKYDATGEVDESVADDDTQKAYVLIGEALVAFINADKEPTQRDLLSEMRGIFHHEISALEERLKLQERAVARAGLMKIRIRKKDGENFIARMLTKHAEDALRAAALVKGDIARRQRAIEILSEYDYSFETIVELVCKTFETI
jgi:DnaJ-class molecular chaperone